MEIGKTSEGTLWRGRFEVGLGRGRIVIADRGRGPVSEVPGPPLGTK
jgi:hypothetical protein